MKDVKRVCARYEKQLRRSSRGRSWKCSVPEQVGHYHYALIHIREIEVMTKQVIDMAGVSPITYIFYYAFARKLDKLSRRGVSGESFAIEAALLIDLWTGRGLDRSVLETIRTQVFNVGPPTP